jgi:hypothetical protein
LSVPIVNLPGVVRVRLAAAHVSGEADGSTDGAVEVSAVDGEGAAEGGVEALDPAELQAAARIAIRASDGIVVLRMGSGTSGCGDARECTRARAKVSY